MAALSLLIVQGLLPGRWLPWLQGNLFLACPQGAEPGQGYVLSALISSP